MLTVQQLAADQLDAAVHAITDGFVEEQNFAHIFPGEKKRRAVMTRLVRAMMRESIRDGGAYVAVEDGQIVGGVFGYPPGGYPFPLRQELRMAPMYLRLLLAGPRLAYRLARFYYTELEHHPHGERYWYLFAIAFRPGDRSLRAVDLVFRAVMERVDRDEAGTYLETGRPELASGLTRYFGFTVRAEGVQFVRGGPPNWVLWRPPASTPAGARRQGPRPGRGPLGALLRLIGKHGSSGAA